MRKHTSIFILIMALTLLTGSAVQAQALELTGSADCEGWLAVSTMTFPSGVYSADLDYSVVLTDLAGNEVTRFDWVGQIYRFENPVMVLFYGESWGLTLDSDYVAHIAFHFLGEEAVLSFDLVCGEAGSEPEPDIEPCRMSPGFWKNNPEAWPVETLLLGGIEMDQEQLIHIMSRPIRSNGSLLMARELVAAKLNVANGCDTSINPVIEDADLFLMAHPLAQNAWRNRVPSTRDLRIALSVYNKAGCPDSGLDDVGLLDGFQDKTAAIEQTSFSALKAMYR